MFDSLTNKLACVGFLWLTFTTTIILSQECKDAHSSCYYWFLSNYCNDPVYANVMFESCKNTCGHCNQGRRTSSSNSVCKDVITSCALYKSYGYCATYKTYMTANCARTCGFCSTTTPKPDSDCKDDNTNCPSWQQYCVQSSRYWPYMSKNCKKTCKICTDGSGGGGGGNGSGKKEFQCSFEGNFCNWSNQHIDDAADWAVGTVAGGPSSGANGTSSYAYVNTGNSGYNARLVLPWELVLPIGTTNVGTMCLNFRYQTGNGNLKFIEDKYPDLNNKIPSPINKGTLSGSGSWVYGKVQVYVDNERALVIEGTPGSSGKVVIDELFFVKGSC